MFSFYKIYQVEKDGIAHAPAQDETRNCGLVPSPVPGSKDSSQYEFSKGSHEVDGPVESKEVEPLKPESLGGLLVLGELALNQGALGAGLKGNNKIFLIANFALFL